MIDVTTRQWLVAHDFTPCGDAAARVAVRDLVESGGGTLVLCHVFQSGVLPVAIDGAAAGVGLADLERDAAMSAARRLERLAEELRAELRELARDVVEIEVAVRQAPTAEGIVAEAEARGAERIAVGTHARRGLSHLVFGSVAEKVVRLSRTPVLVVKEPGPGR